jgi:hypothetical protein
MMLIMLVTIGLALTIVQPSVRAADQGPHVTAVATARAQILSGVRVGPAPPDADTKAERREPPPRRPRERPCPEAEATPCRLMVIDMP